MVFAAMHVQKAPFLFSGNTQNDTAAGGTALRIHLYMQQRSHLQSYCNQCKAVSGIDIAGRTCTVVSTSEQLQLPPCECIEVIKLLWCFLVFLVITALRAGDIVWIRCCDFCTIVLPINTDTTNSHIATPEIWSCVATPTRVLGRYFIRCGQDIVATGLLYTDDVICLHSHAHQLLDIQLWLLRCDLVQLRHRCCTCYRWAAAFVRRRVPFGFDPHTTSICWVLSWQH